MQIWDSVYQNNHLSLMKIHIGLAIFWLLWVILFYVMLFQDADLNQVNRVNLGVFLFVTMMPSVIHLSLAYGARNKSELSRKLSMAVFVLIFLMFPIGSIFSICVGFPVLQWENPNET